MSVGAPPSTRRNKKFTSGEDVRLQELVGELGTDEWERIALQLPGRNSRQCKDRWLTYLTHATESHEWDPADDCRLLDLVCSIGKKWVKISKFFGGRTDAMVKNRYQVLLRKAQKAGAAVAPAVGKCPQLCPPAPQYFVWMPIGVASFPPPARNVSVAPMPVPPLPVPPEPFPGLQPIFFTEIAGQ